MENLGNTVYMEPPNLFGLYNHARGLYNLALGLYNHALGLKEQNRWSSNAEFLEAWSLASRLLDFYLHIREPRLQLQQTRLKQMLAFWIDLRARSNLADRRSIESRRQWRTKRTENWFRRRNEKTRRTHARMGEGTPSHGTEKTEGKVWWSITIWSIPAWRSGTGVQAI